MVAARASVAGVVGLLALIHLCAPHDVKLYNGHKLIRVKPATAEQVAYLVSLLNTEPLAFKLDFWTHPHLGESCDINVPPDTVTWLMSELRSQGMTATVIQNDIQKLIDDTKLRDEVAALLVKSGLSDRMAQRLAWLPGVDNTWLSRQKETLLAAGGSNRSLGQVSYSAALQTSIVGTFPRHTLINTWLDQMAAQYPDLASIEAIGTSYEGREMKMIKVGKASGSTKPVIWVDAAIHAREWLTVGTIIHIINKLLTTYHSDTNVRDLLDTYTWYFLPVVNPDGYEYSHVSDRLWRKTRSPNIWAQCPGTDANRNFDFQWGVSGGVSTSPCTDNMIGAAPFSEKETRNMRDAINRVKSNMKLYIALHTYFQLWLTPWSYGTAKPADDADMVRAATIGEAALASKYGTRFKIGTSPQLLYAASGTASDWVKGVAGVKYAYTLELRPTSSVSNGFVISENQIQPSGEEVWAGLAAVAQYIQNAPSA